VSRGDWRAGEHMLSPRPNHHVPASAFARFKSRASQNGTFGMGVVVVSGFGIDHTSQEDPLSPWGACRGQLWAVPVTWPVMPPWEMRAWHQQWSLLGPSTPPAQSLLLNVWNRDPQAMLASSPSPLHQRSLRSLRHATWETHPCHTAPYPSP
jgi:hypothetical protein